MFSLFLANDNVDLPIVPYFGRARESGTDCVACAIFMCRFIARSFHERKRRVRLHLICHLAPLVAPGVCYGRSNIDVDLAQQARALPALRAQLPQGASVISSPLRRCASLARGLCPTPRFDARLVELDFGSWEMRHWDAIARAEIDAWAADVAGYRPGDGESVLDMAHRIAAFYDDLVRGPASDAIVVCHAGSIRLMAARQRGLDPDCMALEAAAQPHAIGHGEIVVLDCV
jgi:alpha-ribazole phosphatase